MGVTGSVGCGGRNQQYPSCTVRSSIHLLYVHYCLSVLRNGIPHRFCSRPVVLSTERKLLRWSPNLLCSHLGSLTFASIIITLIKLVQMALDSAQREADNCYVKICICCIQCCVSSIEALIQTLNHYAIIIMSLTGQGFVDSAKTGGIIIFSHPALFGSWAVLADS